MSANLLTCLIFPVWAILVWKESRRPNIRHLWLRLAALTLAAGALLLVMLKPGYRVHVSGSPGIPGYTSGENAQGNGLLSIGWSAKLQAGEPLIVQGKYTNSLNIPVSLYLSGFGSHFDSVTVGPHTGLDFVLETMPGFTGHSAYSFQVRTGDELVTSGPVPVEVIPDQTLKVLILNSAPSFENKYLKNWLALMHDQVSMRSVMSPARFHTDLENSPGSMSLKGNLTAGQLKLFDVLVTDQQALLELHPAELAALKTVIRNDGLGLILQLDTTPHTGPAQAFTGMRLNKGIPADTLSELVLADNYKTVLKLALPMLSLPAETGSQVLVRNSKSAILSDLRAMGRGKIERTVIDHSYSWELGGENAAYARLWSGLLQAAARKQETPTTWSAQGKLPMQNEPVILNLTGMVSGPSAGIVMGAKVIPATSDVQAGRSEGTAVYLRQRVDLPGAGTGIFWPEEAGWQSVSLKGQPLSWFYIYNYDDWKQLRKNINYRQLNRNERSIGKIRSGSSLSSGSTVKKPVPLFVFYLVFLFSMTFLWLEKKFFSSGSVSS